MPSKFSPENSKKKKTPYKIGIIPLKVKIFDILVEVSHKIHPFFFIIGGQQRVIGFTQPLLLDASLSYDPDKSYADETFYDWECMDADELACFVLDGKCFS